MAITKFLQDQFFLRCEFSIHPVHTIFIDQTSTTAEMKTPDIEVLEIKVTEDEFILRVASSYNFNKWNGVMTIRDHRT